MKKLKRKGKTNTATSLPEMANQNYYNTNPENPDVIKHTTVMIAFSAFCTLTSPLIYLSYFKNNTNNKIESLDMMDEFYLFLIDLLFHVGLSILYPICIFVRNPDLRRFTIQTIKEHIL